MTASDGNKNNTETAETDETATGNQPLDSSGNPASENFGFYNREGLPTGDSYKLTEEEEAARKKRNFAIAGGLVAFMVLVFLITVLRLSQNIANATGG